MPDAGSPAFPWESHHSLEDLAGSPVLVRVDFNVPLSEEGNVTDSRRLEAALPTIRELIEMELKPVLMAHLGRPGGKRIDELSLRPLVSLLEEFLDRPVRFAEDCVSEPAREMVSNLEVGELGLLENLRFHGGEKENDPDFAADLAELGEAYVNEAFGTAHRAHASIVGVPDHLERATAGNLLRREYEVLTEVRDDPERPLAVLLGGAKVSDKFPLIRALLDRVDRLLIGGAMAHTFFLAQGHSVGDSLVEEGSVDAASELLANRDDFRADLRFPEDVVADNYAGSVKNFDRDSIPDGWNAKDIGPRTREEFGRVLNEAETVFWNGPMGVFEEDSFEGGTRFVVESLAEHPGRVVVGGGDSGAAVSEFSDPEAFDHVSTGGGAALELLQGESLPGFDALDLRTEPEGTTV